MVTRLGLVWACLLLFAAVAAAPAGAANPVKGSAGLQLIADQQSVLAGDTARFHILYQNTTGKLAAETKLTVSLPAGLELAATGGVEWSPLVRSATWTLHNVEAGAASVVHFDVKVDTSAQAGAQLPVTLAAVIDGTVSVDVSTVPLRVAEEIHQPLFIGFPDGEFHLTASLTRAEAAAVVARVKELPAAAPGTATYSDVPAGHWAHGYISRVTASGYMTGSGGKFNPDAPLSRAELVVLLLRLRTVEALPFPPFAETATHWAVNAISTAHALNWIDGSGVGQFLPDGPTERQVAAKLFTVALYRRPLVDGDAKVIQHFPDVGKDSWAFGWVEEVSMTAHLSRTDGQVEYLIRYLPEQTHSL